MIHKSTWLLTSPRIFFGLVFLVATFSTFAAEKLGNRDLSPQIKVHFSQGQLTVDADAAPLGKLLDKIAEEAGLETSGTKGLSQLITQNFSALPLDQAIRKVINDSYSFVLKLQVENQITDKSVPRGKLWIFGSGQDGQSIVSSQSEIKPIVHQLPVQLAEQAQAARYKSHELTTATLQHSSEPEFVYYSSSDPDPGRRKQSIESSADQGEDTALGTLEMAVYDPDPELRMDAIKKLADIGTGSVVQVVATALDDEDEKIRSEAVKILAEIGSDNALQELEKALSDPSEEIRELARQELQE